MTRILTIDIGAGTQDILLHEEGEPLEASLKLVLPSPTVVAARRVRKAAERGRGVHLAGMLMGGGALAGAVREVLRQGLRVTSTASAALSFHDSLDEVRKLGVIISEWGETGTQVVELGDLDLETLRDMLARYEVELPEVLGVAVQDHGFHPQESNRRARFRQWERFLAGGGVIGDLIYDGDVPPELTRLAALRAAAPCAVVCDTGAAAMRGAIEDEDARRRYDLGLPLVLVNIGNAHALVFVIERQRVQAVYEHHTRALHSAALVGDMERLLAGDLTGEEVFDGGGHGTAYGRHWKGAKPSDAFISVTGPRRALLPDSDFHYATPGGDQMMVGAVGILRAIQDKRGLRT